MQTEVIRLENVSKTFDNTEEVLKSISLSIKKNEFFTLLGPSGCGKTTILRIMGGFLSPSSGNVFFDGKNITNLPPNKRELNTVFQKYALFPHMNVYENIAFGLKVKKVPGDEIKRRTLEMLSVVNLEGFEKRDVTSLSGGQQQRVAIARALVNNPKLLLLDEPLGALDLKMRKDMQLELKRIQQKMGITFVYVTHDQEEALTMSDTIVVMNKGEIQQQGTPVDIYNEPKNAFVADFIGESNIVPGVMEKDFLVKFQGRAFNCVDKGFLPNENIDVVIRPEDIKIVQPENAMLTGVVKSSIFKGVHYEMLIECGDTEWMVHSTLTEEPGKNVGMVILPNDIHIMKKTTA